MTGFAALVLAGGRAERMGGGDKSLLLLAGKSLLQRILIQLGAEPLRIAISANGDPARFAGFGYQVLPDGAFVDQGPLAGVLAGLDWAAAHGCDSLLTVPGDTPFIPSGLAAALAPAPACAASAGRTHPLVALWPVTVREALRASLSSAGKRRVMEFSASIGMRVVDFPLCPWDPFLNLNDTVDLAAAQRVALEFDRNRQRLPLSDGNPPKQTLSRKETLPSRETLPPREKLRRLPI